MIHALHIALGLLLGVAAGAAHLAVVHHRARRATRGQATLALALFPVGLLALAAPIYLASRVAPLAVWAAVPGILLVRWLVLRPRRGGPRAP